MIKFGVFRKEYIINRDEITSLRLTIMEALNRKKVDDICENNDTIYFSNNFYNSGRTNWSLMSAVDAGSFEFVKNENKLIASYSIKRMMFFDILVILFILYNNRNDLIFAIPPCILFLSVVFIPVIRYHFFLKDILKKDTL